MAQEVPPYQRLSPDSQPWGRWVTDKIQKNEVAQDSALSNLQAQNKNLAAQLNRLQLQIADLNERRSYLLPVSQTLATTTPGAYAGYSGSDQVSFTLRSPSVVRVGGSAKLSGLGNGAGGSVSGSIGMYVDTAPFPYPSPLSVRMSGFSYINTGTGSVSYDTNVYFSTILELDAGTHVAKPLAIDTYAQFQGSSGSVSLSSIFFFVEVVSTTT